MRNRKTKKPILAILLFISGLIALNGVFSETGFLTYLSLDEKIERVRSEITVLNRENEKLKQEIFLLKNDPFYIERIARVELGMVKRNEIILKFSNLQSEDQAR